MKEDCIFNVQIRQRAENNRTKENNRFLFKIQNYAVSIKTQFACLSRITKFVFLLTALLLTCHSRSLIASFCERTA